MLNVTKKVLIYSCTLENSDWINKSRVLVNKTNVNTTNIKKAIFVYLLD